MTMQNTAKTLIILDRDGVINQDSDAYIRSPKQWQPIQGSIEAIAKLKRAGYLVSVATNQSGIARGLFDLTALNAMHDKMHELVHEAGGQIDALMICPHSPDDHCNCRKPKPGLLLQISAKLHVPLERAYLVGDSLKDLQAAEAAGAKPVLVKTGKGEITLGQIANHQLSSTPVFDDLAQFVDRLLANKQT